MRKIRNIAVALTLLALLSASAPIASAAYAYVPTRYDCSSGTCVSTGSSGMATSQTGYTYLPVGTNCPGGVCLGPAVSTTTQTAYVATKYDCSSGTCVKITYPAPTAAANGVNYTPVSASTQEQELLTMMNKERAAMGLAPYTLDSSISAVAKAKCSDMIANRYFAHQSPTLGSVRDMLKAAGISYRGANENIARYGSLQKAFVGLMSSVGHRNNILSKTYTNVGLSVCRDNSGNYYIVQVFISK